MEVEIYVAPPNRNCDKCGQHVPRNNDSTLFTAIYMGQDHPMYAFFIGTFAIARHLLPVVQDGQVTCEGSPSRAQYLEGQPHDSRPDYPYHPEREAAFREAYREMQEVCLNEMPVGQTAH